MKKLTHQEYLKIIDIFLMSDGVKECSTCEMYPRCPTYSNDIMPCWILSQKLTNEVSENGIKKATSKE